MKDLIKLLPRIDAAIARENGLEKPERAPRPTTDATYLARIPCTKCGGFERYRRANDCAPCQRARVIAAKKAMHDRKAAP